jgi:uncharacterized protein involved in exopolysaccharide biosynthesis
MPEPPHPSQDFIADLKSRWPLVAASCAIALLLAFAISSLLPKRYTATASVLIQPPGGNDPRAATAISPVYLESLKSYERLALSDTLFARAIEHVHAAGPGDDRSFESLKKSILRVNKAANTAILEISATMPDPRKAQALAQFIAEQTVEMSRSIDAQGEADVTREFNNQLAVAADRLARARDAQNRLRSAAAPGLETELENNAELQLSLDKEISLIRTEIAGYKAETSRSDLVASAEARLSSLTAQRNELYAIIGQQDKQLRETNIKDAQAKEDVESAKAAYEKAGTRLNEAVTTGQFRGERLRVIDPGIIPQEPRSPNVPLNMLAALVLSLTGSLAFIAITPRRRATEKSEAVLSFQH